MSKVQAREIQRTFGTIETEEEFWTELDAAVFDETDLADIF